MQSSRVFPDLLYSFKPLPGIVPRHDRAQTDGGWRLITVGYCVAEVERNVFKHRSGATRWNRLIRPDLEADGSIYVIDRPSVFDATKDKPVIYSAIGCGAD
jgi:hypothetical protein